jgi:uncharacterized HhH-GPD family protein
MAAAGRYRRVMYGRPDALAEARPDALHFTSNPAANRLLAEEPLAVLLGMLLDQQVTMEWAFGAPYLLKQRLGVDHLDAAAIAAMDPEALETVFRDKPALHRYPASMAKRAHDLCRHIVEHYGGRTEAIWTGASTGEELLARVHALPGFGKDKSRIFVGVLGKRLGVRPPGWEQVAADWASIADVDTFERVGEIREQKRAAKAAKKAAARPEPPATKRAAQQPAPARKSSASARKSGAR